MSDAVKRLLREPLAHFLALGALLFVFFERQGGAGPGSTRIVVTSGLVEHLAAGFARTWQRPPTAVELKGLVDDYVKEEVATREATAMGLDRDDTIIRRRLRQKLEFLVEDTVDQTAPGDAELQAWLDKHRQSFRIESQVALRQVYVATERHGASARADAEKLLARLRAAGEGARIGDLGDPTMLPRELPAGPLSEVAKVFGADFATRIEALEAGKWTGPLESPYGFHLVLVTERVAPKAPSLSEVRPAVERQYLAERRQSGLLALYDRLLAKYSVTIEMPKPADAARVAAPTKGRP
jgi:hypothetical protein